MRRMHTVTCAFLLTALFLLVGRAPAWAHAHLKAADPAVGGTVSATPAAVTITFTEGVEPRFSGIEVTAAQGSRVDKDNPHLVAGDNQHLAVDLQPLQPGTYTVRWHATAVDTHKTNGTFQFTVSR